MPMPVRRERCRRCGARAASSAAYCVRCGSALAGGAVGLGASSAVMLGWWIASLGALARVLNGRALAHAQAAGVVREALAVLHLTAIPTEVLFTAAGACAAARALPSRRWRGAAGVGGAIGLVAVGLDAAIAPAAHLITTAVTWSALVVAGVLGACVGPALAARCVPYAPFSWLASSWRAGCVNWRFALRTLTLAAGWLAAPWLVLWVFAGSVGLGIGRRWRRGAAASGQGAS